MPEDQPSDVTQEDWNAVLGPSYANYDGPPATPEVEAPPPESEPTPAPQTPEPVPTPVVQPPAMPDLTAQQGVLQEQQFHLSLQQQANQRSSELIAQGQDPTQVQVAAQTWMTQQATQYQSQKVQQQQFQIDKQNAILRLVQENPGITAAQLEPYNDLPSMTGAAQQAGTVAKLTAQVNEATAVAKVPVQQFAGGNATPVASTQRDALNYVSGAGPEMSLEQFKNAFGFDPS